MAWAPDYCTAEELKSFRNIEDTNDDVYIGLAVTAASRAVDRFCNRQFGDAVQTRRYVPWWDSDLRRWVVEVDDIASSTDLDITCDDVEVTDYQLHPVNAAADGKPWTRVVLGSGGDVVEVTASFGWAGVPVPVVQATLLQAARFFMRRSAVFGIAGEGDGALRLLDRVDPDVAAILRPYRRVWGAA